MKTPTTASAPAEPSPQLLLVSQPIFNLGFYSVVSVIRRFLPAAVLLPERQKLQAAQLEAIK